MSRWCVESRDRCWCAVESGEEPGMADVPVKCGKVVAPPSGIMRRSPTCPDCIKVLRQEAERDFPYFKSEFIAVFNCNRSDTRKGYAAVRKQFGEVGVKVVRKINKTGVMAMYEIEPTPETELFSRVVGLASDKRRQTCNPAHA